MKLLSKSGFYIHLIVLEFHVIGLDVLKTNNWHIGKTALESLPAFSCYFIKSYLSHIKAY